MKRSTTARMLVAAAVAFAAGCSLIPASVASGSGSRPASTVAAAQVTPASPKATTPPQLNLLQQVLPSAWSDGRGDTLELTDGGTGRLDVISSGCPLPPTAPHTCQVLVWVRLVSSSGNTATLKVTVKTKVTVFNGRPGVKACIEQGGSSAATPAYYHLRLLDKHRAVLTGGAGTPVRSLTRGTVQQPRFCD